MQASHSGSRVQRVRFELRRREVEVVRTTRISPGLLAVTFGGDALADFESLSFDDHVKLILPEQLDADGEVARRDYTPRHFDRARRELTLEFALHGDGIASAWAARVTPGQRAVIGGPRGSMIIPSDYAWHLLAGDLTALPAIKRRLEELPAGTRVMVVAQVPDPRDRRPLQTAASLELHWVDSPDALLARVAALPLDAQGFAWGAGEAALMARLRTLLVTEQQLPPESTRISAYWKQEA